MRRRIYFLLPDAEAAHEAEKSLLLAHVDDNHYQFMAEDEENIDDLPLADIVHRTDLLPSMWQGLFFGGLSGTVVGGVIYMTGVLSALQMGNILLAAVVGGLMGIWISSMIGIRMPNSQLKKFEKALKRGNILLMVDISEERVKEITKLIESKKLNLGPVRQEPAVPALP